MWKPRGKITAARENKTTEIKEFVLIILQVIMQVRKLLQHLKALL